MEQDWVGAEDDLPLCGNFLCDRRQYAQCGRNCFWQHVVKLDQVVVDVVIDEAIWTHMIETFQLAFACWLGLELSEAQLAETHPHRVRWSNKGRGQRIFSYKKKEEEGLNEKKIKAATNNSSKVAT